MATQRNQKPIPVAILARVSTDKQDSGRQIHELHEAAAEHGWQVVEVIDEAGVFGKAAEDERFGLTLQAGQPSPSNHGRKNARFRVETGKLQAASRYDAHSEGEA